MNHAGERTAKAFTLRPWVLWLVCVAAVLQAWAFVHNVIDRDVVLAVCFGLGTVASIVQAVTLVRLRRQAIPRRH